MTLFSVDEARIEICRSALSLRGVRVASRTQLRSFLFGRGSTAKLSTVDRQIVEGHRARVKAFHAAGYKSEMSAELEGFVSALGLDDGRCDWSGLYAVLPHGIIYAEGETSGRRDFIAS